MNRTWKGMTVAALAGVLVLAFVAWPAAARDSQKGRWLKIRVYEKSQTTPTVLVNLPMGLVSAAARLMAKCKAHATIEGSIDDAPGGDKARIRVRDLDLRALLEELESMGPGQILEVQEDDERVSIWIE